jgi:RNA polymerase sigma-70 factor (ECF subfamily)
MPMTMPALDAETRAYVFAVAMKYVKDEDAAADVAQDALLLAHRHRASFRGDSLWTTWLYRIAATSALMYLRKRRRLSRELPCSGARTSGDDDAPALLDARPDPHASPENEAGGSELMAEIARGVHRLGDKYEPIFWMRYLEGYSESEIASRLGLSLATVKTRAHRAKLAARAHLEAVSALPRAA